MRNPPLPPGIQLPQRRSAKLCGLILAALAISMPKAASGFTFDPTAAEWAWWPAYCKARYLDLGMSPSAQGIQPLSKAEISAWRSQLGDDVFTYVHHHCAGLIWLQRARLATVPSERDFALQSAEYESNFTLIRIPPESDTYADILVHMGQIKRAAGNGNAALDFFEQAIRSRPDRAAGYLGKSLVMRDRKKTDQAIEALRAGSRATGGESRELEYHLGLALLDAGQFEDARGHARRAYELGFPLPALRDRLAAAGYPLD
jgi:tetratricopeptide (TPR) repeat protein